MRNHPEKASVAQYLDGNSSDGETAKSPYFAIYVGVDWRARPLLRAYRFLPHSRGGGGADAMLNPIAPGPHKRGCNVGRTSKAQRHRLSTRIKHGQN